MKNLGTDGEVCPFAFNFDPATFKIGDIVSYRIPDRFPDFPFVGTLVEIHPNYVMISPNDPTALSARYRGTRESRPIVASSEIL